MALSFSEQALSSRGGTGLGPARDWARPENIFARPGKARSSKFDSRAPARPGPKPGFLDLPKARPGPTFKKPEPNTVNICPEIFYFAFFTKFIF